DPRRSGRILFRLALFPTNLAKQSPPNHHSDWLYPLSRDFLQGIRPLKESRGSASRLPQHGIEQITQEAHTPLLTLPAVAFDSARPEFAADTQMGPLLDPNEAIRQTSSGRVRRH